jgi:hypothetical protein
MAAPLLEGGDAWRAADPAVHFGSFAASKFGTDRRPTSKGSSR